MTLIRRSLYQDLVKLRANILDELEARTKTVEKIEKEIADKEGFVANFDKTQDDLTASIASLENTMKEGIKILDGLEEKGDSLTDQIEDAQVDKDVKQKKLEKEEANLKFLKSEGGTAEQIATAEQAVREAEAAYRVAIEFEDSLEASKESVKDQIRSTKEKIDDASNSKENAQRQFEDNKEIKKEYEKEVPELKTALADNKSNLDEVTTEYSDFLSKNQTTINTFETQQIRRDANINKKDNTKVFDRNPTNAEVVVEANVVMKEVIDAELAPANEEEAEKLKGWIEAGRSEKHNPDFLDASAARDLALAANWSTKTVAKLIKDTATNGEFFTKVPSLPNSVIYALQRAGYAVSLSDAEDDKNADIIINWENVEGSK